MTADLQALIDSVPDGSTIVFPSGAVYRVDGMLRFRNRWDLSFEGNGSSVERVDAGVSGSDDALYKRQLRFIGGGNIVIRNLTVVGANPNAGMADAAWDPNYEFQHGIELDGVQGALLDHVQVHDVYGDFVYVGASNPEQGVFIPSRNVTIQNSRFERNGRQGISVTFAEDVLIQNNYMGDVRRAWVAVEPNGVHSQVLRLTIQDNTVGPHRLNFFANAGKGENVRDIVIANNTTPPGVTFGAISITRGENPEALGGYRGPYLIEGNVGPARATFYFYAAADITIRNNKMSFLKKPVAKIRDVHTMQVHDNDFSGATVVYQVNDPTPGESYDYTEWNNLL